jgi:hypothetical protein
MLFEVTRKNSLAALNTKRNLRCRPQSHVATFTRINSIQPSGYYLGLLTYSMEQSPSWAASQEIPRILWNPLSQAPATCP